ncbi:hypothetical protein GCM10010412_024260 [Nonomuraea recticatena]|uniref:Uncharacterized protein n=1 Tax=Nonomuraea recticatena TaxID=46178 RepID=A0ABN3RKP9_9ACTN
MPSNNSAQGSGVGNVAYFPAEVARSGRRGCRAAELERGGQEWVVTGSVSDALSPGSPSMLSLLFLAR